MVAGRIDAVVTGISHIFPRLLVEHACLYFFMSKAHERIVMVQAPLVYNDGRSPMKAPQKITGVILSDVATFIDTHRCSPSLSLSPTKAAVKISHDSIHPLRLPQSFHVGPAYDLVQAINDGFEIFCLGVPAAVIAP